MITIFSICFGASIWFALGVLLVVMWFPVHPKTAEQLLMRRYAAGALVIVWLAIGLQFYHHYGFYNRFF